MAQIHYSKDTRLNNSFICEEVREKTNDVGFSYGTKSILWRVRTNRQRKYNVHYAIFVWSASLFRRLSVKSEQC